MPVLTAAIAAGGFLTLPLAGNGAIQAIMVQPMRLEIEYEGVEPVPVLGRIKTASATITADLSPQSYKITARARTEGMIGWFVHYDLRLIATGMMTKFGLRPARYDSTNKDGKKDRHVEIDFTPGEVFAFASPRWGSPGAIEVTREQKLEARDPLSAIVQIALGADATPQAPCGGPVRIFDGKHRYDLRLKFSERFAWKSKVYSGPVIKCDVDYVEIAGFGPKTPQRAAKDKADMLWANLILADMNDGSFTPPLKLEGRSKKRGKLTIQATRISYSPAD